MKGFPIVYNSSLSVADNAKQNGVTEWVIRKYIKDNFVDRRTERKNSIISDCRRYLEKHTGASRNEIHRNTGYSVSTIRKYWSYITTNDELKGNEGKSTKYHEKQERVVHDMVSYLDSLSWDFLKAYFEERAEVERQKEAEILKRETEAEEEARRIEDQKYAFLDDLF